MKPSLYDEIVAYQPINMQERQDQLVMLEYITMFDNIATRDNHFAHMSSSPWIVNHDFTKVLMIYHNIYDSWGWCGGHLDGDLDMLHVALKEGCEESGLTKIWPCQTSLFAIDILPVPPHVKNNAFVSAHVHLNVTYLCMADEQATLKIKPDENSGVKWVAIEDINTLVSEEDMKIVYAKLIKKANLHKACLK